MKNGILILVLLLFTLPSIGQRLVYPGQNQIHRHLEDPSFISINDLYNMSGMVQVSDSDIAQTSQYVAAQLAFLKKIAFGVEHSKHSYDKFRYSQLLFSGRLKFGDESHYFSIGGSVGPEKYNETNILSDNTITTIYRAGLHYTNFNFTLGGFLNRLPLQNDLLNPLLNQLTTYEGYTGYLSYKFNLGDDFSISPMVKYNMYADTNFNSNSEIESDLTFFEGVTNFNYKGDYKLSVSYKNEYSINGALSAKVFKYIKLNYSYEMAMGDLMFEDVHSLGVSFDLTPIEAGINEWLDNIKQEREEEANSTINIDEDDGLEIRDIITPSEESRYPVMNKYALSDIIEGKLKRGYYIIFSKHKSEKSATKQLLRLEEKGIYARYGKKKPEKELYYLYIDRYDDIEIAIKRAKAKRKEKGFENIWLLEIK